MNSGVCVTCLELCSSFGSSPTDLCCAIAAVTHHLCVEFVDPCCLSAFVVCCLIALDNCPGVYPICIGEIIRRIVSKAIQSVLKLDVLQAAGSSQLCAGHVQFMIQAVELLFM